MSFAESNNLYVYFYIFRKNYNECMKYLSKYENTVRSLNWKIIHNKSVIEFYKNDMKNYEQFEKVLQQVTEGKTLVRKINYSEIITY